MSKYKKSDNLHVPKENVADPVIVPDNTIYILTEDPRFDDLPGELILPLKGEVKREWFGKHHYFCLPLVMGNQHGFVFKAAFDFSAIWNGGDTPADTEVFIEENDKKSGKQVISSHFGYGIVTVQNRWTLRTPRGVNLMVMPPPNYYVHGAMFLTAVVEADNLRRDFTFNIKLTRANEVVYFKKGDPIGCVLPYPRYFIDGYKTELHPKGEALDTERKTIREFSKVRESAKGGQDLLYMQGKDVYRNPFPEHQKGLNNDMPPRRCPFGHG